MRHLSKSASLFGIGAFVLLLAVLSAVAGSGTASADGSDPQVQQTELCTYRTEIVRGSSYYVDRIWVEGNGSGRVLVHQRWFVTPTEEWEIETCGADQQRRLIFFGLVEVLVDEKRDPLGGGGGGGGTEV